MDILTPPSRRRVTGTAQKEMTSGSTPRGQAEEKLFFFDDVSSKMSG
jgi:hypothetical protein